SARIEAYRLGEPKDLRGPLFLGSLALLVIDALVVFWLAGGLYRLMPRRRMATGALLVGVLAAGLLATSHAFAQVSGPLMPANAGIQHLAKDWVPAFAGTSGGEIEVPLIPAQAGIQPLAKNWVPAFAG